MTTKTLTVNEVRAWIEGHGLQYADIARKLDVDRHDLWRVLAGRTGCRKGKPFRIAVGLRLKPAPENAKPTDFALPQPSTVKRWINENGIDTSNRKAA